MKIDSKRQKLSGIQKLAMDPESRGKEEQWFNLGSVNEAEDAPVPGIIQELFPGCCGMT